MADSLTSSGDKCCLLFRWAKWTLNGVRVTNELSKWCSWHLSSVLMNTSGISTYSSVSLTGRDQLVSVAPINHQFKAISAQLIPTTVDDHNHWHCLGSVTDEGGNHPERQSYLMCFVTSSGCLSRLLCSCCGAWECQTASAASALCLPAPLHDIWEYPEQRCFTHEMLRPLSPVRANCQSASVGPWSADLLAELSRAAHLSCAGSGSETVWYTVSESFISSPCVFGNVLLFLLTVSWERGGARTFHTAHKFIDDLFLVM